MKRLKDLYDSNQDVRDSEIPQEWKESFNRFMFGQACLADTDESGKVSEFIYYYCDFRQWYNMNRAAIERDETINKIIE
jgi:hypothetical protein